MLEQLFSPCLRYQPAHDRWGQPFYHDHVFRIYLFNFKPSRWAVALRLLAGAIQNNVNVNSDATTTCLRVARTGQAYKLEIE